jgi:hypothetical protein
MEAVMDALANLEVWRTGGDGRDFELRSGFADARLATITLNDDTGRHVRLNEMDLHGGNRISGLDRLVNAAINEWNMTIKSR